MANNTKTKVLTLRTELDPSGITSGAQLIRQEVGKLTGEIGRMMGVIQKSIDNALKPLNNSAAKLTQMGNSYTKAVAQMSAANDTASATFTNINKQITSMSTRSKNLVGNLNNAATAMAGYATASKGINTASISFRNYGQSVSDSMKLVNGQFDAATRLVRSAKNDIMDLGRIFAMVTAGMVTAIALPTKAFGDFQKELLILKSLAKDFTAKELEQFKTTALQVAYANGLMAKDIAASGIELVRLGLNAKETNMVLKQVADAALANSISIVKAAEVGLGATRAMGGGAKDLANTLNILTRAAVSSATDISGLSETFKYAAPIFNSAEQDIKELGKASIILSNNMIRNSQAGTTLRSMMTTFQAPTNAAREAFKVLGFEIVDVATKKMKPFTQLTQELAAKMEGLETTTKNAMLATIFGKYALSGATALINANAKAYEDANRAINDTALTNEKMAQQMRQGVTFEFNRMSAAVNNAAISMGEHFAPMAEKFMRSITDLASAFTELPSSMKQTIAETVVFGGQVAVVTVGVGGLILSLRTLINFAKELFQIFGITGIGSVMSGFGSILTTVTQSIYSMTSALMGTKLAAAGAGSVIGVALVGHIALAVGALWGLMQVAELLKQNWELLKANIAEEKAWETAADAVSNLTDRMIEARKARIELNRVQNAGGAPNEGEVMSPLDIRRAASDVLNKKRYGKIQKVYGSEWKEIMDLQDSKQQLDSLKQRYMKLSSVPLGEDDEYRKGQLKEITKQFDERIAKLKKYNLLSKDAEAILVAENNQRKSQLEQQAQDFLNKSANNQAERAANKADAAAMEKVRKSIVDEEKKFQEDYQKRRKKALEEIESGGLGDSAANLGQIAEQVAKTSVKVQRGVNECVIATEELFAALGATDELLTALTPGVDSTITNLNNLVKKGLGQWSNKPVPGSIALKPQAHAGTVGSDPTKLIHSSSNAGLKFGTFDNYFRKDPTVKYFVPGQQLFKQGSPAMSGMSRENKALAATQAEKRVLEESAQASIDRLKKLQAAYAADTDMYRAYTLKIAELQNKKADAANDAIKKQIQMEEEARKKMETMYDENLQTIFNLEMDADRKRSEIRKQSLSQQYNEIEFAYHKEIALLEDKFAGMEDLEKLKDQAKQIRDKKMTKLALENQAELTKAVEDAANAQKKSMLTEPQREMFDVQLQIAALERQRAQERGPEGEKNIQLIDKLINYKRDEIKIIQEKAVLEQAQYFNEQKLLDVQNELSKAQTDAAKGLTSQLAVERIEVKLAKTAIATKEQELEITKRMSTAYRNTEEHNRAIAAATQALVEAKHNLLVLEEKDINVKLRALEIARQVGQISDADADAKKLSELNDYLSRAIGVEADYKQKLSERNDLMIKVNATQGNFMGMLSGILMKSQGVAQMSQVQLNLWEGMTITGEQLTMGLDALGAGFGKLIESFTKSDQIMSEVISKVAEMGSAFATVAMGLVSGNPIQIIGGVVQALGSLKEAVDNVYPSEEQMAQRKNALLESLIDIEAQSAKTETRLKLLRGEITELQAAIADQTTDAEAKQKRLDAMKRKRADLEKEKGKLSPGDPMLSDLNPLIGMIERGAKIEAYLKTVDKITELNAEIDALDKELKADLLQNAMDNNNEIQKLDDAALERKWAGKAEEAKLTRETLDDVDAAYNASVDKRKAEMREELEAAMTTGEDIAAMQDAHRTELFNMAIQYMKDRAKAEREDKETKLTEEEEANKKIEEERQEHLKKLYDMERQSAVDLLKLKASRTYTKDDDIKADAEAERKAAGDRYQAVVEEVKGNSELELKIKREALQAYLIEIENADDKERRLLADNNSAKAKAARDIALIEAQNSRNTTIILSQELQNQYDDLEEWKAKEIDLAMGDGERLLEIEREYQAKRVQAANNAEDKIKELMVNQLGDIKTLREQVLKVQSMQYDDAIRTQERFLLDLNKQRDDLQRQIQFYDNQIDKQRQEFNKKDKDLFESMLGGVNIPEEIRKGLELIANPTGVPNNRFSRDSQRKAIQERIDMLTQENENLRDLEERSSSEYWAEESRIALIQAAAANEQLTNTVTVAKMTAKEKLEVQSTLADAYKRYQEAQLNLIEDQYVEERELANAQLLQNKLDQDQRNAIIAENKYQLDLLTATYQKDMDAIDKEILDVTMSHQKMKISVDDVKAAIGNMTPIIDKVIQDYKRLQAEMKAVAETKFPQGPQPVSSVVSGSSTSSTSSSAGSTTSSSSGGLSTLGTIIKNSGQKTAPAGYPVTDGNYWYSTTSQMYKAQSLGLKDGGIIGMIPNQDKYKGDKYPLMPGVRGDAGELLVSPIEKLRDLMPAGNNYSIMVTGNSFRDEVDFKRVMMEFARERDMRDSMSTGQFYSNLRR